ncbi:MAG: recombinase family protein [Clostridia bacterium]|nr:recombinase family protein [Clostridia bacterium]
MVYGYCRVSTKTQARDGNSFEDQAVQIINAYPNAELVKEAYSGASKDRPMFNWLMRTLDADDILVVTKLDRFCRSVKEGLEYIEILDGAGVTVHVLNMGIFDGSPTGKIVTTMMLAFAEFERSLILERTQAGKALAREKPGYREGRPEKVSREEVKRVRDSGMNVKEGCEMLGISRSTWYAKLAEV